MDENNQAIKWANTYLLEYGYTLKDNIIEEVQKTPWSYIARFITTTGFLYLKQTPQSLALEPCIIQILSQKFTASVPEMIAHNEKLNCFLMKDAGVPLREILKKQYNQILVCKTVDQFSLLQLSVTNNVNDFINIGMPDWRLNKLPALYSELISKKDILLADGLSELEVIELEKLNLYVASLCEKLASYSIKETIVQPDFNDNNSLVDQVSQKITIIDLGEIAISHPFFSFINFLGKMKLQYHFKENNIDYVKIKDVYLQNFMFSESQQNVLDAFGIARKLFPVYKALSSHRLLAACDKSAFTLSFERQARPGRELIKFIVENKR